MDCELVGVSTLKEILESRLTSFQTTALQVVFLNNNAISSICMMLDRSFNAFSCFCVPLTWALQPPCEISHLNIISILQMRKLRFRESIPLICVQGSTRVRIRIELTGVKCLTPCSTFRNYQENVMWCFKTVSSSYLPVLIALY